MGDNGSGTYTRNNGVNSGSGTWTADRDAGTKILASRHDTHDEDIATALTARLCKNGETTPTANLPMGGFGHTNTAAATARTMYARASQVQDSSLEYGGTSTGAANVYAISLSPAVTSYPTGLKVSFKAHQASTSSTTLNINSVAATAIKIAGAGADTATGSILNGQIVECEYDGTYFQLLNPGQATAGLIADDAITFAKMQNITSDRLLGRDTAASGNVEEISLDDTLEFNGSGALQRAALSGDVSATAGSNTTAIGNNKVTAAMIRFANGTFLRCTLAGGGDVSAFGLDSSDRLLINSPESIRWGTDATYHWEKDTSGHLKPITDSAYDIGTTALKPRRIFGDFFNGSLAASVAAAGTTSGTATLLSATINHVATWAPGSEGVRLPAGVAGDFIVVTNPGPAAVTVYPPTGGTINSSAADAGRLTNSMSLFVYVTSTTLFAMEGL